jgi:hypothetical protein
MRRKIEIWMIVIGVIILTLTVFACIYYKSDFPDIIKVAAAGLAVIFFAYKLVTGWLFINLNIELEAERTMLDQELDHIVLHIILDKGEIDSLWLKDIDIIVSELDRSGTVQTENSRMIKPYGMTKVETNELSSNQGAMESKSYVLSPKEKTCFAAYLTAGKRQTILLEVKVFGTRPFYGIEYKNGKLIQWGASTILLPRQESAH